MDYNSMVAITIMAGAITFLFGIVSLLLNRKFTYTDGKLDEVIKKMTDHLIDNAELKEKIKSIGDILAEVRDKYFDLHKRVNELEDFKLEIGLEHEMFHGEKHK